MTNFSKRFLHWPFLSHRSRDRREILRKLIMSHESLSRMVDYSHKMIDTIAKEVEDNFITRKWLFLSIVGIRQLPNLSRTFLSPIFICSQFEYV